MGAALGGFFMLYVFSVMEKFPVVLPQPQPQQQPQLQPHPQPQQQPQAPQPTLEQLFGAEELPQEVTTDDIPMVSEPTPHRNIRKIVIREYYDDEKPRATRQLEKKIQAQLEKIAAVEQKVPTRRTSTERVRLATRGILEQLLADLRGNPHAEEQIRRHVEDILV
jgi:hypothetical protein